MSFDFLTYNNHKDLIDGVKLQKLTIHRDPRGLLVEVLRSDWEGIVDKEHPYGQTYRSVTFPGFARDEDQWHNHPTRQVDRFVVVNGSAVFALYDWRKESPTFGKLDLFLMGDINGDDNQYLLLIPKNVLHGFCTVGKNPCILLGNPTETYDPKEEGRINFSDVTATFSDGTPFAWNSIRAHFEKEG